MKERAEGALAFCIKMMDGRTRCEVGTVLKSGHACGWQSCVYMVAVARKSEMRAPRYSKCGGGQTDNQ